MQSLKKIHAWVQMKVPLSLASGGGEVGVGGYPPDPYKM